MKTKILLGVTALFLVAGASIATAQGLRQRGGGEPGGRIARMQRMARSAREHRGEIARRLGITQEQRDLGRAAAQQIRPLAESLRPQARAIVQAARALARSGDREGARNMLKTQLKPLIESARAQARPIVQPLIQSLTPEQRAKIEAWCAARGKTFDENKLADRLAWRLAHAGRGRGGR